MIKLGWGIFQSRSKVLASQIAPIQAESGGLVMATKGICLTSLILNWHWFQGIKSWAHIMSLSKPASWKIDCSRFAKLLAIWLHEIMLPYSPVCSSRSLSRWFYGLSKQGTYANRRSSNIGLICWLKLRWNERGKKRAYLMLVREQSWKKPYCYVALRIHNCRWLRNSSQLWVGELRPCWIVFPLNTF